jgi:DNA polymerase III subunit delta'
MYNWNIIGHKKQLELIEHDITSHSLAHAYLFAGPSHIGKFAIAKMFVNILQCTNNLCHTCSTCKQLQAGSHPDTIVIDNEEKSIKIERIREVIGKLQMTKQASYKVLLINGAHKLTPEASNCLLKTLEEPPPHTIIIMTTNNVRDMLPTIISRVRLVKFSAYSQTFLAEKLSELYPETDKKTLNQVCSLSLGKSGRAIKLLEDSDLLASYRTMYNMLCEFLEDKPIYRKFGLVDEILSDERDNKEFLDIFTHLVRSRLHQELSTQDKKPSKKEYYLELLSKLEETRDLLKRNINARLALESLALKTSQ